MVRALILSLLLAGCTTMLPHSQVADWPALKITLHKATFTEINDKCLPDAPTWQKMLGYVAFACTWVDLNRKTCDIYTLDGEPEGGIFEHELAHCYGADHDGILQRVHDSWRKG
jgi:hypothetical protein